MISLTRPNHMVFNVNCCCFRRPAEWMCVCSAAVDYTHTLKTASRIHCYIYGIPLILFSKWNIPKNTLKMPLSIGLHGKDSNRSSRSFGLTRDASLQMLVVVLEFLVGISDVFENRYSSLRGEGRGRGEGKVQRRG